MVRFNSYVKDYSAVSEASMLRGKNILVGVCGGISAYKICGVVSALKQAGAVVEVVMTQNAQKFVTPLTFQSLSGRPVHTDMFSPVESGNWDIDHIALAKSADLIAIAPATANVLGKLANGLADDLLTATVLASKAPVLLVPAMNTGMWENAIVRDNVKKLGKFGFRFLGPVKGKLACGDSGNGRMIAPDKILEEIQKLAG